MKLRLFFSLIFLSCRIYYIPNWIVLQIDINAPCSTQHLCMWSYRLRTESCWKRKKSVSKTHLFCANSPTEMYLPLSLALLMTNNVDWLRNSFCSDLRLTSHLLLVQDVADKMIKIDFVTSLFSYQDTDLILKIPSN